MNFGLSTEISV